MISASWASQALRDEGVVTAMAEPTLTTMSGRPASFLVGGEQAVPVPAGLGQIGVQFEEFGTRLNFLPIVLGNGKIHLEVEPEVAALDVNGTTIEGTVVPGRDTTRVNTTAELEDGQTFVIGGLIQRHRWYNGEDAHSWRSPSQRGLQQQIVPGNRDGNGHDGDGPSTQSGPAGARILPGQETRCPDDFELFWKEFSKRLVGRVTSSWKTLCSGLQERPHRGFSRVRRYRRRERPPAAGATAGRQSRRLRSKRIRFGRPRRNRL